MPEVIIKYKKPETLKILKGLAKYLDFKVEIENGKPDSINGVTIIKADKSIDASDLTELFSGRNIDPAKLRKQAWTRKQ